MHARRIGEAKHPGPPKVCAWASADWSSPEAEQRDAGLGIMSDMEAFAQGQKLDLYAELGLQPTATAKEVLQAYRRMAVRFHPDKQQDAAARVEAQGKLALLNLAKEVLSEPIKRSMYDFQIQSLFLEGAPGASSTSAEPSSAAASSSSSAASFHPADSGPSIEELLRRLEELM